MKPNYFSISMYPTVSFNEEEVLLRLLDVFESNEKFAPTHWGHFILNGFFIYYYVKSRFKNAVYEMPKNTSKYMRSIQDANGNVTP